MLRRSSEAIAIAAIVFFGGFLVSAVVYAGCSIGGEGTYVEAFTLANYSPDDEGCSGMGSPHCGAVLCADNCVSASYMVSCTYLDLYSFAAIAPTICGEGCN
jgi:hypothetical protein